MTCRCGDPAHHYIGGGQWACFRHWLMAAIPVPDRAARAKKAKE